MVSILHAGDGGGGFSIPLLEQFDALRPGGDFAWIAEYKPLAQKYLSDCRLYAEWKKQANEAESPTRLAQTLEHLRALKKDLKTRSALSVDMTERKRIWRAAWEINSQSKPLTPPE